MMENWRQSEVQHKRLVANWQQFQNLDHLEHLHMIRDVRFFIVCGLNIDFLCAVDRLQAFVIVEYI